MDDRAERRRQRAHRVLDAAGELILRLGYDKTTVDDVARAAGVAKGTVYLHWRNREELFVALLRRERVLLLDDVVRRVEQDDEPLTPRRYVEYLACAQFARPLLRAVLVRDLDVLGKLAAARPSRDEGSREDPDRIDFAGYLAELRDAGLVRTDVSAAEQVTTVGAIFLGFFVLAPLQAGAEGAGGSAAIADDRLGALLADAVDRALDRGVPLTDADRATAARIGHEHLRRFTRQARERFALVAGTTDPQEATT